MDHAIETERPHLSLRPHPRRRRPDDARADRQHLRAARPERRRQDDDAEDADEPARRRRAAPRASSASTRARSARPSSPASATSPRTSGIPSNLTIGEIEAFCRPWYPTWDAALATELRERFGLDPARPHQDAVARHAPQGAVPARARAAAAPADPRRAVQRPRSGRARRPDDRRPQPRRSRRLERAADVARDGRRRAAGRSRRLPRQRPAASSRSRCRRCSRASGASRSALPDGAAVPDAAPGVVARVHGRRARRALRRVAGLARRAEAAWQDALPGATIEARPMSLREVFVALTRAGAAVAGAEPTR